MLAQEEARADRAERITSGHLIIGCLREEEGNAAKVLGDLGVTLEKARECEEVTALQKRGDPTSGQIAFTSTAKKALELALREALSLGHNYIGTEHILLGIERYQESDGASMLTHLGVLPPTARDTVVAMLSKGAGQKSEGGVPSAPPSKRSPELSAFLAATAAMLRSATAYFESLERQ